MRLLLDTHVILWWLMDDPRLSRKAVAALDDTANELFVSAVAAYEIAYKQGLGRLSVLPDGLPRRLQRAGIAVIPLSLDHALAAGALRGPHRDPWDRIMMAQAMAEALTVVTVDSVFTDYGVPALW
ncbi:MAG TPA: type II toxin-antitoxin system VapC family toxin [Stellaceae bacterium]|nr:type II toxin-antitoxin system VapC family toxin [Stellaceae bacterium]